MRNTIAAVLTAGGVATGFFVGRVYEWERHREGHWLDEGWAAYESPPPFMLWPVRRLLRRYRDRAGSRERAGELGEESLGRVSL